MNLSENSKIDSKSGKARRKTVKKLLVGGGILSGTALSSATWIKPVIDTTLLPAHAGTTETYQG